MSYNIPPYGRLRFHSRYRWVAGQSTLSPLQIKSVSNSPTTSNNIKSENLNDNKFEKCQNKINVSIENKGISNSSQEANLINNSSLPDMSSNLPSTTLLIKESINSEALPQSER
ncbi:unnamed protein product [Cercopithifilaria johnstoni]|uniref:Uncharacterized protein n=1 Tax=Cercopithifilaria johnstoni TaxID=2874296 RepID=A0A8J2Q6F8_9BILA|nr:unnamed protein product [Cercopithifilaria johnstoni]